MITVYLVAVMFSSGDLWMYSRYDTAREACVESTRDPERHHPFRATVTREGRVTSMVPLRCRVRVEAE